MEKKYYFEAWPGEIDLSRLKPIDFVGIWNRTDGLTPDDQQYCIVSDGKHVIIAQYFKLFDAFYVNDYQINAVEWMAAPTPSNQT